MHVRMLVCNVYVYVSVNVCNVWMHIGTFYYITCLVGGACTILTVGLVSDQLAAFDVSDGREEGPDVVLGHVLRQIVDDEVRLAIVVFHLVLVARADGGRRGVGGRGGGAVGGVVGGSVVVVVGCGAVVVLDNVVVGAVAVGSVLLRRVWVHLRTTFTAITGDLWSKYNR